MERDCWYTSSTEDTNPAWLSLAAPLPAGARHCSSSLMRTKSSITGIDVPALCAGNLVLMGDMTNEKDFGKGERRTISVQAALLLQCKIVWGGLSLQTTP